MGTVPNVGLMAQKAEEYGSHDKTFEIAGDGTVRVVDAAGKTLHRARRRGRRHLAHVPGQGRAGPRLGQAGRDPRPRHRRAGGVLARREPRPRRPAHREGRTLPERPRHRRPRDPHHVAGGGDAASRSSASQGGKDTISVTGNVLRDYLTDLFPILEVGTSAKMLSIVPLMNGGGLFETGAGGSAPKHVQQFEAENHLRWDSLGEFLALAVSLEHLGRALRQRRARRLLGRDARRGHRQAPARAQVAVAQGAASSTTAAATSTSRCTGPRRWPRRPTTPSCAIGSRRSPRRWPRPRRRSSPSSTRSRASPWTSAATTSRTPSSPTRRCGRAPRSTPSSTPCEQGALSARDPARAGRDGAPLSAALPPARQRAGPGHSRRFPGAQGARGAAAAGRAGGVW